MINIDDYHKIATGTAVRCAISILENIPSSRPEIRAIVDDLKDIRTEIWDETAVFILDDPDEPTPTNAASRSGEPCAVCGHPERHHTMNNPAGQWCVEKRCKCTEFKSGDEKPVTQEGEPSASTPK